MIVTHEDLTAGQENDVRSLHRRLYALESAWAQHLEGSYIPRGQLRRMDWAHRSFLFLDNGANELVRDPHCNTAVVRWLLRERGVILAGPDPKELVEPITAADLRREARARVREYAEWAHELPAMSRWEQPYLVLTLCRLLFTLATGRVAAKREAGDWALAALDPEWAGLVRRALADRADPWERVHQPADRGLAEQTVAFAAFAAHRGDRRVARPRGLASAPVTWGVWERAEGDDLVPAELLLRTVAELGFAGIELGPPGYLDPRTILDVGVELVGGFAPLHLDDEEAFAADLAAWLDPIAAALAETGRRGPVVLADAGRQAAVTLDGDRLARALERVSRAAERCRDQGVDAVFHHHAGTYVETPEEIAAFMQGTDVPLCFDTGHAVVGGGDPVELARTYATRIEHLHVKDVDPVLLARLRSGELTLEQAWRDGIFCPLGQGIVDVRAVLALPELQRFEGWIVLEQDRVAVRVGELPAVRAVEQANLRYVQDLLATP